MAKRPTVPHRQAHIAGVCWTLALVFGAVAALPFVEGHFMSGTWAVAFLAMFATAGALVIALMFTSRARKVSRLRSDEALLARWELDDEMLRAYVGLLHEESSAKSKALIWVVGFFFAVITLGVLFFLEAGERMAFAMIMATIFLIVWGASRFFPWYYRRRNLKADRQIWIGAKYAYINGYFHNWDFPLSGLSQVGVLHKPFHGLHLVYYYTDRTLRHTHTLKIPAPADMDLQPLVEKIRTAN